MKRSTVMLALLSCAAAAEVTDTIGCSKGGDLVLFEKFHNCYYAANVM